MTGERQGHEWVWGRTMKGAVCGASLFTVHEAWRHSLTEQ